MKSKPDDATDSIPPDTPGVCKVTRDETYSELSPEVAARGKSAQGDRRVCRGGMIGAGAWSEPQLAAWAEVDGAEIVALCDRHPERRNAVAERFGIRHQFDHAVDMFEEMDLDFIDICTRPYSHSELIRQALPFERPILCQKPFCTRLDEARAVVEACRQASIPLMINENYRWQAWFRQARALLASGRLGQPFLARIDRRTRFTLPHFEHHQAYFADMPRLILYEMGVHFLDTLRFLFGEPQSVYARLHHISPHMKGEDVEVVVLGYENLTCVVQNSWASVQVPGVDSPAPGASGVPRFEIEGTLGTLSLNCSGQLRLETDTEHQQWSFSEQTMSCSRVAAQQHFIDCLNSDVAFETSGTDTLKTMALVYAAYESAEKGRVVDVRSDKSFRLGKPRYGTARGRSSSGG